MWKDRGCSAMPALIEPQRAEKLLGILSRGDASRARVWGAWLSCLYLGKIGVVTVGGPLARHRIQLWGHDQS